MRILKQFYFTTAISCADQVAGDQNLHLHFWLMNLIFKTGDIDTTVPLSSLITNDYERTARLRPTLLVSLPLILALICFFSDFSGLQFLAGFTAYFGLTTLIAQLGRDEGKRLEPRLFEQWGGKPTTQLLRHRNSHLDTNTKKRYHDTLSILLPRLLLPGVADETNDPLKADAIYESCTAFLRERTRDKVLFPIIFAENVSYGFRRNLWGMKKAGIVITTFSLLVAVSIAIAKSKSGIPPALPSATGFINACILVWWLLRITPSWVRTPAFAYAERLLAACDTLHQPTTPKKEIFITPN